MDMPKTIKPKLRATGDLGRKVQSIEAELAEMKKHIATLGIGDRLDALSLRVAALEDRLKP